MIRRAVDPLEVAERVARAALAMIEPAEGVLVGLLVDEHQLQFACGAGTLACFVGQRVDVAGSVSGDAIRTGRTLVTHDTESDPRVHLAAAEDMGVRSSVCVPLRHGERRLGVVYLGSSQPYAFGPRDVALLSELAEFMSAVIATAAEVRRLTARLATAASGVAGAAEAFVSSVLDPAGTSDAAERARVERLLRTRAFTIELQPIFDLANHRLLGVESLARFDGEPRQPPDAWLARAHRAGLGIELELMLIDAATALLDVLPTPSLLAINAGPDVLATDASLRTLGRIDPQRIVVELTEQAVVNDYPQLKDALRRLRELGIRLAVDDAGAGWASLVHILKLAPDFIKLDRQLTHRIDVDPVRRALAASLAVFAGETGAQIIAEGIETEGELRTLQDLGVAFGQGYHLAAPTTVAGLRPAVARGLSRCRVDAARRARVEMRP